MAEKTNIKTKHILRYTLLIILVLCLGGLCGFSLSSTGQNTMEDAYGRIINAAKANFKKQVTINGQDSGILTYKETMNRKDAPVSRRSDSYGTYDVYADKNDNEYVFLLNSDLLCGYKAKNPTADYVAKSTVTQAQAKKAAEEFMDTVFGDDSRTYRFESITPTQMYVYYIDYAYYINGIKTDDICTMWVRTDTGEISAWHAFNRGRYDGYTGKNFTLSGNKEKLETGLPFLKSKNYEIDDQYITLSDDGTLIMHYEVFYTEDGVIIPHTFETPIT